jgi:hypothetical protein
MNFSIGNKTFATLLLTLLAITIVSCNSDRSDNQPTKSSAALNLESTPKSQLNDSFCEDFAEFESNFCNGGLVAVNVLGRIQPFQDPSGKDPAIRADNYLALELGSEAKSILIGINMHPDTAVITRFTSDGEKGYLLEGSSSGSDESPLHNLLYDLVDARTVAEAQSIADSYLGLPSETINDEDENSTARVAIYDVDALIIDEPDGPEGLISGCYYGERRTINRIANYLIEAAGFDNPSNTFRQGLTTAIRNEMRYRCGDEFRENDCMGCVPNIGCALNGAFVFLSEEFNGNQLAQLVDKLMVDVFNFSPGVAFAALAQEDDMYLSSLTTLFSFGAIPNSQDCERIEVMYNGIVRDLLLDGGVFYQNTGFCPTGTPLTPNLVVSNNNLSFFLKAIRTAGMCLKADI